MVKVCLHSSTRLLPVQLTLQKDVKYHNNSVLYTRLDSDL